jgi:hypothetical protein
MTDISNPIDNSTDVVETAEKKRGRKKGQFTGARSIMVTMSAIIDQKLVHENYICSLTEGLSTEEGKKITNSEALKDAFEWFEETHGVKPQAHSEPYYIRSGTISATGTAHTCPYEFNDVDLKKGHKSGIYKDWKIDFKLIEQSEDWVYISKFVSKLDGEKKPQTPSLKLVHIDEIKVIEA